MATGTFRLAAIGAALAVAFYPSAPASAEKTAEQIKCEEEGGTWQDKGNGNTFCFKKLPPMQKADGPSTGGQVTQASVSAPAGRDDHCDMAIDELGMPVDKKDKKGKGTPIVSASQSGQTLKHAINTKGTGAAGKAPTSAGKYTAPVNIATACR